MKRMDSNDIRSGHLACSLILITSLLLILFCHCYKRSYAMAFEAAEAETVVEEITFENTVILSSLVECTSVTIEDDNIVLAGPEVLEENLAEFEEEIQEEEIQEEVEKTEYDIPSSFVNPETGNTVSYKGGKTLERSSKITYGDSGVINDLAEPDQDGFMMLDDRYLVAVGSRFNTVPGQYLDLVLENGVVIKCMMGDAKADVDTDSTNTFTYRSRCCSEFIIDKHTIRSDIYERGNASLKYPSWDSPVVEIIVYDDYHCIDTI
ncbi:hypothetical protein SAMN05421493_10187 [Pseudobutyrivibrio sp. 49]|nr:hypothetical protein SAMN05421493_10187 [Pseudobutyrivibrio sp. 49]